MKNRKKAVNGFTLIELLVVVLIIGILAAVALPQYQKAVQKARFTEALTNIHTLQQAAQAYLLEHGLIGNVDDWTNRLDVAVASPNFTYTIGEDGVCDNNHFLSSGVLVQAQSMNGQYFIESDYCNNMWYTFCMEMDATGPGQDTPGTRTCALFNQLYPQNE